MNTVTPILFTVDLTSLTCASRISSSWSTVSMTLVSVMSAGVELFFRSSMRSLMTSSGVSGPGTGVDDDGTVLVGGEVVEERSGVVEEKSAVVEERSVVEEEKVVVETEVEVLSGVVTENDAH